MIQSPIPATAVDMTPSIPFPIGSADMEEESKRMTDIADPIGLHHGNPPSEGTTIPIATRSIITSITVVRTLARGLLAPRKTNAPETRIQMLSTLATTAVSGIDHELSSRSGQTVTWIAHMITSMSSIVCRHGRVNRVQLKRYNGQPIVIPLIARTLIMSSASV